MTITTGNITKLNLASDLSKRHTLPSGVDLTILARVYDGRVLKVLWEGREWYTANPEWQQHPKVEKEEKKQGSPWDAPWRRKGKRSE